MKEKIKAFGYRITGLERLRNVLIGHQAQLNSQSKQLDDSKKQLDICNSKLQELQEYILAFENSESEKLNVKTSADMPYFSLNVRGITYFYDRQDTIIPSYMINSGCNWAETEIENFIKISDNYYSRQENGKVPHQGLFLDIGGNIGTTSIYCKKKLKKKFKYLAFEPLSVSARLFVANAAINGFFSDISVEKIALSDQKRERAAMVINYQNWGGSGLLTEDIEDGDEIVSTMTLDQYLVENSIDQSIVKYIWIDVEGHEPEMLKGAASLYKEHTIPTCLEFNQNHYMEHHTYEKMIMLLEEYFDWFIVCQSVTNGKEELRPIHEVRSLWEELGHNACDLILI